MGVLTLHGTSAMETDDIFHASSCDWLLSKAAGYSVMRNVLDLQWKVMVFVLLCLNVNEKWHWASCGSSH